MIIHTPIRSFLLSLPFSSIAAIGQTDVTFPNVSAQFEEVWLCMTPNNGQYYMYETYQYSAEPSIDSLGFTWGLLGNYHMIAIDGPKILMISESYPDSILTLYDFSLQMGDTAYFDMYYTNDHVTVTSMDTLEIQGRLRKRFFLSNEDIWIEGIGSLLGLFRPIWEIPLGCGHFTYEFCANYVDEDEVPYSWCSDLVMNEKEINASETRVYPTPCDQHLTISSDRIGDWFRLSDMNGRILRSGILVSDHHTLDVSDLAPGMYLLFIAAGTTKVLVE